MTDQESIETAVNDDLRNSREALLRAARRAREIAMQTGTTIVVMRNGALEHIHPTAQDPAPTHVGESDAPYGKQP